MNAQVCAYCEAPITDAPVRCLVCGGSPHRPSAVLELPDRMWWCVVCQTPWPCSTEQGSDAP